jgi:predicted nuclease of predicted toxin-antitoxin system
MALLGPDFGDIRHVRSVGLGSASDLSIWRWAKTNDFAICSKDSDFFHLVDLQRPPKVIWLRVGNRSTHDIAELLASHVQPINQFLVAEGENLLVLG